MWIITEYLCGTCGERFESLEDRTAVPETATHCCGGIGQRVISAPSVKVCYATATTGKSDGPPSPHATDTRALADGMSTSDWRISRQKKRRDERRAWARSLVS